MLHNVVMHCAIGQFVQAQQLAELAIDAREKADKARQKVAESERDLEDAKVVKAKLDADIAQLRHVSAEPSADKPEALKANQSVDIGAADDTDEQNRDAELRSRLQQLDDVTKMLQDTESKVQQPNICRGGLTIN